MYGTLYNWGAAVWRLTVNYLRNLGEKQKQYLGTENIEVK